MAGFTFYKHDNENNNEINNIQDFIKVSINIDNEIGRIIGNTLSKISKNIPIQFKELKIFGNGVAAITLPDAILLNKNGFSNVNKNNLIHCFFVILHEIGHFKRWDALKNKSMADFIIELSEEEFLNIAEREEKYANEYAENILKQIASKFKNEKIQNYANTISKTSEEPRSKEMYRRVYHIIKNNIGKYNSTKDCLMSFLDGNLNENKEIQLRKIIFKKLQELFKNPEIAPAEPKIKPDIKPAPAPAKPNPNPKRRILPPKIHPGADPLPKAIRHLKKKVITKPLQETPMKADNPEFGKPHEDIRKNIETRGDNPFSKIDILHKGDPNYSTIQKLSDEEYNDVTNTLQHHGKVVSPGEVGLVIQELMELQNKYKKNLEKLAKNTVQRYFGVPNEVMENIFVELKENMFDITFSIDKEREKGNDDKPEQKPDNIKLPNQPKDFENPDEEKFDFPQLVNGFTEEEQKIIKQHVDKRIISNALMMGAGFRAHNLLEKVKPALDAMSPELYPIYSTIMHNTANHMWKIPPAKDVQLLNKPDNNAPGDKQGNPKDQKPIDIDIPNEAKARIVGGKSNLKLGKDENGDGIREVIGAEAQAIIFPVLLHETIKAVIEYIFAHGLPQYSERINQEIMRQSEKFHFEHWHKLLGPRLWKYLHDAIDYIVKARGDDYTIVAYLLQEISMLPPNKFLTLMDYILHDGQKAVIWLEKILDHIEEQDNEENGEDVKQDDETPQADFDNINNLMGQIQNLLKIPDEHADEKKSLNNHKPFNQMSTEELNQFWEQAIEAGEFELAAQALDELEKR